MHLVPYQAATATLTRALRSLRPPPKLKLSEFIEREVRLPDDVSALPGPIRLYPFQRGIADAIGDPAIERCTIQKSARVGYSSLLVGAIGNFVVNDPAQILVVIPVDKDGRKLVVENIEPIFSNSPALDGKLSGDEMDVNRNTMMSRRFSGGSLNVVAAKSPNNLRGYNTRVLFMDEVDSMAITVEGDPVLLAEGRTTSFPDRKIVIGSTPVDAATSLVCASYDRSDKRVFEIPCHECGDFHEIMWEQIRWPAGEPEKANWCCPSCGSFVEHRFKTSMVAAGRWRATAPDVQGHAGFRINSLVSPLANASWSKLAAEFEEKKDDPDKHRTFKNLVLGLPWEDSASDLDEAEIASRGQRFGIGSIPESVLYVTMGVDVQDDRLEATTAGWDRDGCMLILSHDVLYGSPDDDNTWRQLDALINARHSHPLGGQIGIDAVAVDSGDGDWTQAVYDFTRPRARRRVMSIKGMSGNRKVIDATRSKDKRGLFIVGVDVVKTTLMDRVSRNVGIRFSDQLEPVWFEQFLSERKTLKYISKRPVTRWERIPGRQAEALDATVYAFAARQVIPANYDARAADLREEVRPVPKVNRIESDWMKA
ncbi:MAG: phage terminase large subunit family protein [Devosia sp.]